MLRRPHIYDPHLYLKGMLKKVSDMNKAELIEHMKASGEWHRTDRESKAWARAFKLYEQSQGQVVDMDCGKCWAKVADWIRE